MKIVITGATGMVGRAVVERLAARQTYDVVAATRAGDATFSPGVRVCVVGDLSDRPDWSDALNGADVVIHTAAKVHQMQAEGPGHQNAFQEINSNATRSLAMKAAAAGVRRFIFVSTIKVNGEMTCPGQPFKAEDIPAPADAYAFSKYEAEQGLKSVSAQTGMEYVIVRPPLVYGPGVKANFRSLMLWLNRRVPLPLGAIHNRRSMIGLDNLVDLLIVSIDHPNAADQIFLASDNEDLSTTQLLRRMGGALGRQCWLLPVPVFVLRLCAKLVGRSEFANRLCNWLQVDIEKTRKLLNWQPPVSVDDEFQRTATAFLRDMKQQ